MILYVKETGIISPIPVIVNGIKKSWPDPANGVYEYVEPTYNPEIQTLGKVIIVNNIATKEIIPYPNWRFIDYPARITVREKLLRKGKKFESLAFDSLIDNLGANSERIVKNNKRYRCIYLKFLESSNNTPQSDFYFTLDTETGIITPSDNKLNLEQIRSDFFETEFDGNLILTCNYEN